MVCGFRFDLEGSLHMLAFFRSFPAFVLSFRSPFHPIFVVAKAGFILPYLFLFLFLFHPFSSFAVHVFAGSLFFFFFCIRASDWDTK